MTNILSIPFVQMTVVTGNNEDWVEAIKYQVEDPLNLDSPATLLPQLDLRGISFEMEVRRKPHDHEVVLSASTADRKLGVAPFPNFGFLLLFIPIEEMKTRISGDYVADVIAVDDVYTRKIIQMELTILEGITR